MKMPFLTARKTGDRDESFLKGLAKARSTDDAQIVVQNLPPLKAMVAAVSFATILLPSNLRKIEQAAAADELANKSAAQAMRGYKLASVGHDIKREWLDSGRATEMGRVSAKTVAWCAAGGVFYNAAALPFMHGLAQPGWEGLAIAAASTLLGYSVVRGLKGALEGIDRAFAAAKINGDASATLSTTGAVPQLFEGLLLKLFTATHKLGARTLDALGGRKLRKLVARFASNCVTDARAFAISQALIALTSRSSGFGAWGKRRKSIERMAHETRIGSLAVSGIPDGFHYPLAYDGLLPNGDPIGAIAPAMITEHHLGFAARAGVTAAIPAALATLAIWHPAMLNWSQLFEHPVQHLLEGALNFSPATSLAMGGLAFVAAFRSQLSSAYAQAQVPFVTKSVEQLKDFPENRIKRESDDADYLRQLKLVVNDDSARFALGKFNGHMNWKGYHDQPVRGTTFELSAEILKMHGVIMGGTGSGKSFTVLGPLVAHILTERGLLLAAHTRQRELRKAIGRADANKYRGPKTEARAISMFVQDYKLAMSTLLQEQAAILGQAADVRQIGPRLGEYAMDLLEGLSAQQAMDILAQVVTAGGDSSGKIWEQLARNVARAAAALARAFQYTDEGLVWARMNDVKPFSIRFIYDMCMDSSGDMVWMCLEPVMAALARKDPKVTDKVDSTFNANIETLVGDQWLGAPAPETKMGVLINIQQLLGPLVSDPMLGSTFASGVSDRVMSMRDVFGSPDRGALTASNLSFDLYGQPATILNAFLKLRLYLETQNRQTAFRNRAAEAEAALGEIHAHLFSPELADESLDTTREYLRLQREALPTLRAAALRAVADKRWPIALAVTADGELDETTMFGPGPFQSQFRRGVRILKGRRGMLSKQELDTLEQAENFRREHSFLSGGDDGAAHSAFGFFSGTRRTMAEVLAKGQRQIEVLVEGVAAEERMLENYINLAGAPACRAEGLKKVIPALDRHAVYLIVDEYTSLATVGAGDALLDDIQAAKTLRSANLRIILAFQTLATLIHALGSVDKANSLLDNFRTRIALPDETPQTLEMIRALIGTVNSRKTPKHGIMVGGTLVNDLPYAETIWRDGSHAMNDLAGYNKNPTMPYSSSRLDAFCVPARSDDVLKSDDVPDEIAPLFNGGAPFNADLLAGKIRVSEGFSFEVKPEQYTAEETPLYQENNGADNRNEIAGFKRGVKDAAAAKNVERLDAPVEKVEPIDRKAWAHQNKAFVTLQEKGNRPTIDLVDLTVTADAILVRGRAAIEAAAAETNALIARAKAKAAADGLRAREEQEARENAEALA